MKTEEYRTHMTLWVLLAAPLLAGNDLSKMSAKDKAILMNREAIAVDQDALGRQAERVWQRGDISLWRKPLTGGRFAIGLVNNSWSTRDIPFDLREIGFDSGASVRDVWAGRDLGRWKGDQSLTMEGHSAKLWIFKK